jgi:hypothetical protein
LMRHQSSQKDQRTRGRSRSKLREGRERHEEGNALTKSRRRPSGMMHQRSSLHRQTSNSSAGSNLQRHHTAGNAAGSTLRHRSTADSAHRANRTTSNATGSTLRHRSTVDSAHSRSSVHSRTTDEEDASDAGRENGGRMAKRRSATAKDRMRRRGSGRAVTALGSSGGGRLGKGRGGLHRAESAKRQPLVGVNSADHRVASRAPTPCLLSSTPCLLSSTPCLLSRTPCLLSPCILCLPSCYCCVFYSLTMRLIPHSTEHWAPGHFDQWGGCYAHDCRAAPLDEAGSGW